MGGGGKWATTGAFTDGTPTRHPTPHNTNKRKLVQRAAPDRSWGRSGCHVAQTAADTVHTDWRLVY
jgi:hypothetical protein